MHVLVENWIEQDYNKVFHKLKTSNYFSEFHHSRNTNSVPVPFDSCCEASCCFKMLIGFSKVLKENLMGGEGWGWIGWLANPFLKEHKMKKKKKKTGNIMTEIK